MTCINYAINCQMKLDCQKAVNCDSNIEVRAVVCMPI